MKKLLFLLIAGSFAACNAQQTTGTGTSTGTESSTNAPATSIAVLPVEEYKSKMMATADIQLIDVRTPGEYAGGTIGAAKNINFNDANFEAEIAKLDREKPLFIFCASGNRSGRSAPVYQKLGFKQVYDLQGGYGAWKRAGN